MLEKKLNKLLEENETTRTNSDHSSYFCGFGFDRLGKFILKKLSGSLFKKKNAKIISNHFDEIFPYIVQSNMDQILLLNFNLLSEQPNFKEKFTVGLRKYPYKDKIDDLFYNIHKFAPNKFDDFVDDNMLKTISVMDLSSYSLKNILNILNEDKQRIFLNYLVKNECNIPYLGIEYKGNNKQIIYEGLPLFIKNSQNLYELMNFVKDNPVALAQVKNYIDNNEEKAINSIFCETEHLVKIKDEILKKIIKLIVLDVMRNENAKFSEITYNGGGFSRVLEIGDKVVKLGDRVTKNFPNNPYIIAPLLRKELESNGEHCFTEVTERVDTSKAPSKEELYQLFKNLRDLNLVWTDIKGRNVGRLKKENVIHWNENLIEQTPEMLGLNLKRGEKILKAGDWVILDADFIYDENDPNINYANQRSLYNEFEERYQKEKELIKNSKKNQNSDVDKICESVDNGISRL